MEENSLLDKSILIGFCFPIDIHHDKCREYLSDTTRELYATDNVNSVYERRRQEFVQRHRRGVRSHVRELTSSDLSGTMTNQDIEYIFGEILRSDSDAYRYLKDYYTNYLDSPSELSLYEMKEEISQIIRGYESLTQERKERWDSLVLHWECQRSHPRLDDALSELKEADEEDFEITVEAHDLATETIGTTKFVTSNPAEFARDRYGQLILEQTDIWDIDIVAVTKSAT